MKAVTENMPLDWPCEIKEWYDTLPTPPDGCSVFMRYHISVPELQAMVRANPDKRVSEFNDEFTLSFALPKCLLSFYASKPKEQKGPSANDNLLAL